MVKIISAHLHDATFDISTTGKVLRHVLREGLLAHQIEAHILTGLYGHFRLAELRVLLACIDFRTWISSVGVARPTNVTTRRTLPLKEM